MSCSASSCPTLGPDSTIVGWPELGPASLARAMHQAVHARAAVELGPASVEPSVDRSEFSAPGCVCGAEVGPTLVSSSHILGKAWANMRSKLTSAGLRPDRPDDVGATLVGSGPNPDLVGVDTGGRVGLGPDLANAPIQWGRAADQRLTDGTTLGLARAPRAPQTGPEPGPAHSAARSPSDAQLRACARWRPPKARWRRWASRARRPRLCGRRCRRQRRRRFLAVRTNPRGRWPCRLWRRRRAACRHGDRGWGG